MRLFSSPSDTGIAQVLKDGAVGILPTDTVYGLVCAAKNRSSVERLYSLKSREHKPGTIIAADIEQLADLGLKRRYLKAVEGFWPGAVSVIIPTGEELDYLHQGMHGLAVRVPDNENVRALLIQTGPLLTTSANHPGEPTASTLVEAKSYFDGNVDFYVEGGDLSGRPPSTVIRIVDDAIEVLRQGAVRVE
jgi:L-threonylcarbamoyladenylate synthase